MAVVEAQQPLNGELKIDISKYIYRAGQEDSDSESSISFSSDSDDENDQKKAQNNIQSTKSKGELDLCDLPPIEELQITVKVEDVEPIGEIASIVNTLVIVLSNKDCPHLNEDSVLFLHNLKPLGKVFEILGPVVRPLYAVRFNSADEIKEKNFTIGMPVFYAPGNEDISIPISIDTLKQQRGSDASWAGNNEPPVHCIDYSDDEEERAAKRKTKQNVNEDNATSKTIDSEITLCPGRMSESRDCKGIDYPITELSRRENFHIVKNESKSLLKPFVFEENRLYQSSEFPERNIIAGYSISTNPAIFTRNSVSPQFPKHEFPRRCFDNISENTNPFWKMQNNQNFSGPFCSPRERDHFVTPSREFRRMPALLQNPEKHNSPYMFTSTPQHNDSHYPSVAPQSPHRHNTPMMRLPQHPIDTFAPNMAASSEYRHTSPWMPHSRSPAEAANYIRGHNDPFSRPSDLIPPSSNYRPMSATSPYAYTTPRTQFPRQQIEMNNFHRPVRSPSAYGDAMPPPPQPMETNSYRGPSHSPMSHPHKAPLLPPPQQNIDPRPSHIPGPHAYNNPLMPPPSELIRLNPYHIPVFPASLHTNNVPSMPPPQQLFDPNSNHRPMHSSSPYGRISPFLSPPQHTVAPRPYTPGQRPHTYNFPLMPSPSQPFESNPYHKPVPLLNSQVYNIQPTPRPIDPSPGHRRLPSSHDVYNTPLMSTPRQPIDRYNSLAFERNNSIPVWNSSISMPCTLP